MLAEKDWDKFKRRNPQTLLKKNKVAFLPYRTDIRLPVKGRVKLVLVNENGKQINTIVYVVKGQEESLLGQRNSQALGIIKFNKRDYPDEEVNCITGVRKVLGNKDTEVEDLFSGIGKAKLVPIHIFTKEGRTPVAQKRQPVAHHFMQPLRDHLDELPARDVIEGLLGSKQAMG